MRVYKVTNRHEFPHRYVGTQAEAKQMVKALQAELRTDIKNGNCVIGEEKYIKFSEVEIPTDKEGLINWINNRFV